MIELILKTLAENPAMGYTLEEVTCVVRHSFSAGHTDQGNTVSERADQAVVLEVFLALDNEGLIILNPLNDKSYISTAGMQRINNSDKTALK